MEGEEGSRGERREGEGERGEGEVQDQCFNFGLCCDKAQGRILSIFLSKILYYTAMYSQRVLH